MTDKKIVAYDPGLATGVAEGRFSETEPLTVLGATIIPYEVMVDSFDIMRGTPVDHVVSEVFTSTTSNPFAPDLTGVRVEGILEAAYGTDNIVWRNRTKKEQVPDSLLKEHNIWFTGLDVDWEDGRDANDAVIHMLGYVAFDLKHRPTLRKYFRPNYGSVELRG